MRIIKSEDKGRDNNSKRTCQIKIRRTVKKEKKIENKKSI